MKISVIVPVYNAEQYILRCTESILGQTYKELELILVDDGSPDNSGRICDELSHSDNRVKVFHKSNGGVSSARNFGLTKAKGDYICFIDSDDYVDSSYLEDFNFTNRTADLFLQGYKKVDSSNAVKAEYGFRSTELETYFDVLAYSELNNIINSPCFKLFKREIISKYNIRFDEKTSYGEDHLFSLDYVSKINSISYSLSKGYNYVVNDNESLTQRKVPYEEVMYYSLEAKSRHDRILENNNSIILEKAFRLTYIENLFRTIKYFLHGSVCLRDYKNIISSFDVRKIVVRDLDLGWKRLLLMKSISFLPSFISFSLLKTLNR